MRLRRRSLAVLLAVPVLAGSGVAIGLAANDDPLDHEGAARIQSNQPAIKQFRSLALPRGIAPCAPHTNPGPTGIDDIGVVCLTANAPAATFTSSLRRWLLDLGATEVGARCVTLAGDGPRCGVDALVAGRPFGLTVSQSNPGTATAGQSRAFGGLPPLDRFRGRSPVQRLPAGTQIPLP